MDIEEMTGDSVFCADLNERIGKLQRVMSFQRKILLETQIDRDQYLFLFDLFN